MNEKSKLAKLEACSFCKRTRTMVRILINGPGVIVCDGCVAEFNLVFEDHKFSGETSPEAKCSFCSFWRDNPSAGLVNLFLGIPREDKKFRLISSTGGNICEQCLETCNEILLDAPLFGFKDVTK